LKNFRNNDLSTIFRRHFIFEKTVPGGVWATCTSTPFSLFEGLGIKSIGYCCGGDFYHKVEQYVEG
jgi:hypothetical protein